MIVSFRLIRWETDSATSSVQTAVRTASGGPPPAPPECQPINITHTKLDIREV